MLELTTIGDYRVRAIDCSGPIVRYAATHVVLPRQAIIELLEPDAPRIAAIKLMRRACILEALHHAAVPRVFECGRLQGRPWIAIAHDDRETLHDELQQRRLGICEVLALLEQVAAVLSHAHARGVLHGDISPMAIVREPSLAVRRWESACVHDTELASTPIDGREDVFALAKTACEALTDAVVIPEALAELFAMMLAKDVAKRPTATEVVAAVRAIRDTVAPAEVDATIAATTEEPEEPEIVIEYQDREDEPILLDRRRSAKATHAEYSASVIVDLDACG